MQTWTASGDAVSNLVEAAEFFDIQMDHLAGPVAFVASHRLGRFQVTPTVEAMADEDPPDGGA